MPQSEFRDKFFLQTSLNEKKYFSYVSRLRNSNTTAVVVEDINKDCNNGIYIDIFPFDGLVNNLFLRKLHFKLIGFLSGVIKVSKKANSDENKFNLLHKFYKILVKIFGYNFDNKY